jgi:uncharacterized membrane protein YjgN (DUF898 family)
LTAYLLAPLAHQRIKQYQFDNCRFGHTAFSFGASAKGFYILYLSSLAVMVGAVLLALSSALMLGSGEGGKAGLITGFMMAGPLVVLTVLVAILVVSSLFSAYMQNLVWGNTALGTHRIFSRVSARRLLWVRVSNFLGIMLTLGLFTPFAAVRMARLQVESMGVAIDGDLSSFVADQQQNASAAGEETAEMFDVDISF